MKVSEYTAAFDEKYAAADAERKQFLAEGRKKEADNIKMPFWYDEVVVPMEMCIRDREATRTGSVRRFDDLGRIVVPREIRKLMGCEAVSYTHLDVYKRQGIYHADLSLRAM